MAEGLFCDPCRLSFAQDLIKIKYFSMPLRPFLAKINKEQYPILGQMKNPMVPTIVVVDDDALITISLKALFNLETNYNVLTFTSPVEALEAIQKEHIDLIISDFLMPGMDGIRFLVEAKKYYPEMTALLLTGYADKENAIKAINEAGIYRYIEKPWDSDDLLLSVKNGLERSRLIVSLQESIQELDQRNLDLSTAKTELEAYNIKLEEKVRERTLDLDQAYKNLQQVNGQLEAIIHSSVDGILTLDGAGMITSANSSALALLHAEELSLLGKEFFSFLTLASPESTPRLMDIPQVITQCEIQNGYESTPVTISIAPIKGKDQVYNLEDCYVAVIHNIMYQRENEKLREEFIATLTHDLRTPLHATIQSVNILLDGLLGKVTPQQTKLLETLKASNEDLLNLVNTVLDVYKYESVAQLNLFKDKTDIHTLILQCLDEYTVLASKKGTTLNHFFEDNSQYTYCDKQEIKRVLLNLIGNAIIYTSPRSSINIFAKKEEEYVKIEVQDNGPGLSLDEQKRMFQRFSQGIHKNISVGTGLGLYLSKQIIENHKGKMGVVSTKGNGCTFYFTLKSWKD